MAVKQYESSKRALKIEHKTLILMVGVSCMLCWFVFFVFSSIVAICIIDNAIFDG
jgi:hypothetical protein